MPMKRKEKTMSELELAETFSYRGYEIRVVGDAIINGFGVGDKRYLVKKNGEIVTEQSSMEGAKKAIDAKM
jgi:hypothetical protein